jgi:hypothetical protein
MNEEHLYLPVKRFLESQHYEVKGEIHDCDLLAVRGAEDPVVVELKLSLNLGLILQAVDRLAVTPKVYIGVPRRCGALKSRRRQTVKLLRMLGLGLLAIDEGRMRNGVEVLLDPGAYRPRQSKHRRDRLLGEFVRRVGDPNLGGTDKRRGIMTAYRQTALLIGRFLHDNGPTRAVQIARTLGERNAWAILHRNVYGWFERASLGVYGLSPRGRLEIPRSEEGRRSGPDARAAAR